MFHTLIHARPIFHRHRTPIDRQRMGRVGWESAWECKIKNDKESEDKRRTSFVKQEKEKRHQRQKEEDC